MNKILIALSIVCISSSALAQQSGMVLCLNKKTQQLEIKTRCTSRETRISGKNVRAFGTLGLVTTTTQTIPSPASNGSGFATAISPASNTTATDGSSSGVFGSGVSGSGVSGSSVTSSSGSGNIFSTGSSSSSSSVNTTGTSTGTTTGTSTNGSRTINVNGCYSTTARNSGSTFDGRVSVGLVCSNSTDVLLNEQFSTTDSTSARPLVESKQLLTRGYPTGVAYTFLGVNNRLYSIELTGVCCPVQ